MIFSSQSLRRFLNNSKNQGRKRYEFEIKREYVKGFYEKLLPLAQGDLFIQAELERQEKEKQARRAAALISA